MKTKVWLVLCAYVLMISCKKDTVTGTSLLFPKVKAIIATNCNPCHLSTGDWRGRPVKFDTDQLISDAYQAIKRSLVDPISPTNIRMPQMATLRNADIDIIIEWYNKGGKVTD